MRKVSRSIAIATAGAVAFATVAVGMLTRAGAVATCIAGTPKCFSATLSPAQVGPGSTTTTFTLTVTNESPPLTQSLGSINLTPPSGFNLTGASLPACPTPVDGSPPCATIASNVLELRNLGIAATLPATPRSITFSATTPSAPGTYTWTIAAKQSNDFNGTNNDFTVDQSNSSLTTTVAPAPPPPPPSTTDLAVTSLTQSPANPVTAGSTVVYTATATNNGPAASGAATFTDRVGAGTIIQIARTSGSGAWVCSAPGSGATSASCTLSAGMANGETDTFQIQASSPASGSYNDTATVSSVAPPNDSNPSNNSAVTATTVSSSGGSGTGTVTYGSGGSASLGAIDNTNFTGTVTFPPAPCLQTNTCPAGTTGTTFFAFTISKLFGQTFCGLSCNFAFDLNGAPGIPVGWNDPNHPVQLTMQCHSSTTCGPRNLNTGAEVFKQGSLVPTANCSLPLVANPHPCVSSESFDATTGIYTIVVNLISGDPRFGSLCIDGGC